MKKASVCVYVFVCVCQYMTVAQVVSVCALAPPPGHVLVYHIVCMCIIISRRYIYIYIMYARGSFLADVRIFCFLVPWARRYRNHLITAN